MPRTRIGRREALEKLGAAAGLVTVACGDSTTSPTEAATGPSSTSTGAGTTPTSTCSVAPTETVGPFPSLSDMFRGDIREGKPGVSLQLTIRVVNANAACAPVANAIVEIWQCDHQGNYSSYGTQVGQTYLRGMQTASANGEVVFTTIYPGWYQGRATHIHIEVTVAGRSVKVTQIAFPEAVNNAVHATGVYASRGSNPTTNLQDGIFSDSLSSELVTPAGSPTAGYTASFQLGISV